MVRDLIAAIRALPDFLIDRMDRWVLGQHQPLDIYEDGRHLVCLSCKKPWPCPTFIELTDRRAFHHHKETQQ